MADGGPDTTFTSFVIGAGYLNVIVQPAGRHWSWWGRLILHVSDVDALYEPARPGQDHHRSAAAGCQVGRGILPPG
ncbi:MAG: hypothetical protein O6853_01060 [Actinobacteria bacterium]|nr:hypothetical protein [Actinomycetota bacterium]